MLFSTVSLAAEGRGDLWLFTEPQIALAVRGDSVLRADSAKSGTMNVVLDAGSVYGAKGRLDEELVGSSISPIGR